jgi:hypothetical protein
LRIWPEKNSSLTKRAASPASANQGGGYRRILDGKPVLWPDDDFTYLMYWGWDPLLCKNSKPSPLFHQRRFSRSRNIGAEHTTPWHWGLVVAGTVPFADVRGKPSDPQL